MSAPLAVELAFAGIAVGSAAALSGIGLVVCYRATGVLNLAQGAIAMVTAYALRQCVVVWHWPKPLALCACLLVFAPALGWSLDVLVFRRLQRRGAGTVQLLVACLGVFVLLVGAAYLLWGPVPRLDAPKVLPFSALWVVLVLAAGVAAVSRFTGFGRQVRAVVDNRGLAELAGVDADRVSSVGWAFSAFTAGLTGALLAPELRLDPFGLPLLVMETVAVAVLAGLRSLTLAVASALLLGVAQAELTQLQSPTWHAVSANLFVLALLAGVLWLLPRGDGSRPVAPGPPVPADDAERYFPVRVGIAALLLIPFAFRLDDLRAALQVPALALVLLSVVVVTGYGGQISLGQAGYAGVGALLTGTLAASMPPLLALALAVLIAAPLGLLVGWPAIRRRGLALALTTFAVGTAFSRLVFQQPDLTSGLVLDRGTRGLLADDRFFYALELALLLGALTAVRLLRRGPVGRALGAMRDHEPGAAAAGVAVPRLKLGAFVLGAALAALGGSLLALGGQAFDASVFDPVQGLVWFAAVIVLGPDSAVGALLAAALLTALPTGPAIALLGLLALLPLPAGGLAAFPRRWLTPTPPPLLPDRQRPPRPPATTPPGGPGIAGENRAHARSLPAPLLAEGVVRRFGGVVAVAGVSLDLPAGTVTGLVGANGAGKSTLFDCLSGAATPDAGRVLLGGRDVTALPAHRRARLGLLRGFQQIAVFPGLTVGDNIRVGAEQAGRRRVADPAAATEAALRTLGLAPLRDRPATDLPTGTLRLVELGRALAAAPAVLLLDEPAAGLDRAETERLVALLRRLADDGLALLLVEHDRDLVDHIADQVRTMTNGQLDAPAPVVRRGP